MGTLEWGFLIGIALHLVAKWTGYISAHKDNHWRTYWTLYTPLVVKGTVFDVVIFALWQIGLLAYFAKMVGMGVPEGYEIPGGVDIWLGIALGYAADSLGKTFMGALERFYSKGLTTLSGKAK